MASAQRVPYQYWLHLSRLHSDELGFLPAPAVAQLIDRGRLLLELENNEPCGFLLHGPARRVLRVYQTCIQVDARRIHHALHLVADLRARALAGGSRAIVLHCAEDLDANAFWRAAGFTLVGKRRKSTTRERDQLKWMLPLCDTPPGLSLAELDPPPLTRPPRAPHPAADALQARLGPLLGFAPRVR